MRAGPHPRALSLGAARLAQAAGAADTAPVINPRCLSTTRAGKSRPASGNFDLHSKDMRLDLTGRVALVTGASSGIGAATATTLADLGARVAIGYHHNQRGAEETRDGIVRSGGTAIALEADVRQAENVRALIDRTVSELGPIDILVNNAGSLIARQSLRDTTDGHLDEVLALNFKSAVLASQAVAESMINRHRGAIVNVVSIAGHNGGGPGAGPYAAAKAALTAYTKALAKELAP